jgi:hypothetical protein
MPTIFRPASCRVEPWGDCGAVHIDGERRVFAAFVFEIAMMGERRDGS